jgi:hypothetical protein
MLLTGSKFMSRRSTSFVAPLFLFCLALSYAQSPDLPPGPAQSKVITACLQCHESSIIVQQRLTKVGWTREVDKMIKWGVVVGPGDREAFIEYLSTNFPDDKGPYVAPKTAGTKDGQERLSTCVDQGESKTDSSLAACQGRQDGGAAEAAAPEQEGKKRNWFRSWLDMADEVQATQPDWLSPIATTSGRLKQEFRYDIWDQPSAGGNHTYQFGGNKGLEFITSSWTQLLIGVPTYTLISPNGPPGGFGDLPLMLKLRISSSQPTEGNYLLTFILGATVPTGSHRYGSSVAVLTPSLAFGKGWKRFDVQSTFGASLTVGDTAIIGRQLLWNTTFQYQAAWKLWPELEANATFYDARRYAGNTQLFLTPGLGFGRVHLSGRFRFSSGVGLQIAATRFHTYNHRWMFSTRVSF